MFLTFVKDRKFRQLRFTPVNYRPMDHFHPLQTAQTDHRTTGDLLAYVNQYRREAIDRYEEFLAISLNIAKASNRVYDYSLLTSGIGPTTQTL